MSKTSTAAESEMPLRHLRRRNHAFVRLTGQLFDADIREDGREGVGHIELVRAFGADLEHDWNSKLAKARGLKSYLLNARRSPSDAGASAMIDGQSSVARNSSSASTGTDSIS
jgi:hypothetical protein